MASAYLVVTVVMCLAIASTLASEAPLMARPHCQSQCGNVNIPYPFGIGSNCFFDKWYEVVCDNSTATPRPVLKQTRLEVLNFSWKTGYDHELFSSYLQVRNPISFFNCAGKQTRQAVNLTATPFSFSEYNKFVAVSCGVLAKLDSSSGIKFSQIGCSSTCSGTDNFTIPTNISNITALCINGIDCCQTSMLSSPKAYKILFDNKTSSTSDHDEYCKLAFLVDEFYWSDYQNHSRSFMKIRDTDYAPVILNWHLNHTYFDIFKTNIPSRSIYCETYDQDDGSFSFSSLTINTSQLIYSCSCNEGLRGNAYLTDGCQDIDECQEDPNLCDHGSTCVNTYGNYHCTYRQKFILIGFGSGLGALVLVFGLWSLYRVIRKRDIKRKKKFFKRNGGLLLEQQISSGKRNVEKTKLFKSDVLEKATDHFNMDRILGQGGQGTVYKGMLEDGKIVAVKRSKLVDEAKLSEFINEVVILSQINHRNVVKLLGCCLETEVPLLVYEFIPNGTLFEYIHMRNKEFPITWKMRLQIAREVAGALSYLHAAASFPIYHRDIKSTNILLDEKYRAKIADFGTSRTISLEQTHLTTVVYGTVGYLDPEYFQSSQFTEKSDVYSFGVVLVELLSGQEVISMTRPELSRNLATYFLMAMEEDHLFDILDAQVIENAPTNEEIIKVANLAKRCLNLNGRNRPTMKEVALELEGIESSEGASEVQPNHEEVEHVRTELIEPWDAVSTSTELAFDNTGTRSSLVQELPLLSFDAK